MKDETKEAMKKNENGYSIVEVMITLVVAATFLAAFYQIYNATYNLSQDALERAYAVNMASRFIDEARYYAGSEDRTFDSDNPSQPAPAEPQPVAHVQQALNPGSGASTTISQAFSTANTEGNAIIVSASYDSSDASNFTCSDSRGNSYTTVFTRNNAYSSLPRGVGVCYATDIAAGTNTVTVTYNASTSERDLYMHEYSGIAKTDAVDDFTSRPGYSNNSANNVTTGNVTTTVDGALLFATTRTQGTTNISAGSGYTLRAYNTSDRHMATEDRIQPTAGTAGATFSFTQYHYYAAGLVAFKPQVAEPPSEPIVIPFKNQPGARGDYRVVITTNDVSPTLQQYNVEVTYGPDSNRKTVKLSTFVSFPGGLYY